ncbi:MAG: hypothetical protein ACJ746_02305 [Bryobacteraceae bacterium]
MSRNRKWGSLLWLPTAVLTSCFLVAAEVQDQPVTAQTPNEASRSTGTGALAPDPADNWHVDLLLYLWFPGAHGTLGATDRNADFRATPGDLLSHFRSGLMGAVQVQRGRFVLLTDLMWTRLRATNATTLPIPGMPQLSAETKANELFITPEIGYRFIAGEKLKADWFAGVRYWHLQSSLQLTSPRLRSEISGSRNWVDPLMGFHFQFAVSPRLGVHIIGDAGVGGSDLDFQALGFIGYKSDTPRGAGGLMSWTASKAVGH